jgi:putative FmdB family regulatory protein
MPLYEYQCEECGTFSAFRKVSESSLPAICESCGGTSERVISAPHFAILGKAQRQAHESNEKSAHEPRSMRRSGCGCSGAHTCKSTAKADQTGKSDQQATAFQRQTKKTARPWMLGH